MCRPSTLIGRYSLTTPTKHGCNLPEAYNGSFELMNTLYTNNRLNLKPYGYIAA